MNTFIETYKNKLPSDVCEIMIKEFHENSQFHTPGTVIYNGENAIDKEYKVSTDIGVGGFESTPSHTALFKALVEGKDEYCKKYNHLDELDNWSVDWNWNIQYYKPNEGFFAWHCERGSVNQRLLAWMFNLNTVEKGGETEFKYYDDKIKPLEGQLSIFPAEFTHAHRGVTSTSQDKYIATGWISYVN